MIVLFEAPGSRVPELENDLPELPSLPIPQSPLEAPTPLNNVAACALNQHVAISAQFVIL